MLPNDMLSDHKPPALQRSTVKLHLDVPTMGFSVSPFVLVASFVLVVTVPWLLLKSTSTTPACPSSAGGWKEGDYKAVTIKPPITSPQTSATVQVVGGKAIVRRRKWLEVEEEGMSKTCWYRGREPGAVLLEWEGLIVQAEISDDGAIITIDNSTELVKIKMAVILPTGQWYAPSAVINDAWYCNVLHCIAWYSMVLHGIAWYCMVLHCFK